MRREQPAPADMLGAVLDALADRIAARIGETRERETYSSTELPPRTTRRRFAELCRSGRVFGAHREGSTWVCSREAWEAARRRTARRREADPATPSTTGDLDTEARVDAMLARAGLRVVGGR